MTNALSRRDFLAMTGALGSATMNQRHLTHLFRTSLHAGEEHVTLTSTVIRGNARFQILSPTLIRMEYAPNGQFIDAPSVAVTNRVWSPVSHTARDVNGWLELSTSGMLLKYKLDATRLAADTLTIAWKTSAGEHSWKPGDPDDKNLGGIPSPHLTFREFAGTESGPLSRNGYFCLDDSTTAIWNAKTDWPEARPDTKGRQDLYFFVYGQNYAQFFREATQLSGAIPMVPRYILGTWIGSRAANSSDEWKRVIHRFREEEIPIDLLVLDSPSWARSVGSGYGWDPEHVPDPKGFLTWLRDRGIKATLNEHYAGITPQSDPNFDTVRRALNLPPDTQSIEHALGDKHYAQLYMDVLHKPALDDGIAFWWQDSEGIDNGIPGLDPLLWMRHVEYVGQERLTKKRTFIFCRWGSWGGHRYGSYFTGDISPRWSVLELLVPFNVQAGNTLVPYVANLTAAYWAKVIDPELYQRWVQFSALSPIFWWHGYWGLRFPWEYGAAIQQNVKEFLELRYRLIPYLYTYTRLAHETGMPLVRGTYLHYPQQEQAYTFRHQYLLGTDLLVAPITESGGGRPVTKAVYLPEGDGWYDYFTGTIYQGGQVLSYECPLDRIPLFVRAGAIIPMAPVAPSSDADVSAEPMTIDVYPGNTAQTFRLYEDDGTSLDYREHQYSWTPMTYVPSPEGAAHLTIGPAEGHYHGQPTSRTYRIRVHGITQPTQVILGTKKLNRRLSGSSVDGWSWSSSERVLEINVIRPMPVDQPMTVMIHRAGIFQDQVVMHHALAYRARVRRIKTAEQLRWALLLGDQVVKKEPHVMQVTSQVEQELNDLIDNPAGAGTRPPDFRHMTAAILTAFITAPFDSSRKFPEIDGGAAGAMEYLANKTFTSEQIHHMTADLLDCRLIGTATTTPSYGGLEGPTLTVHAQVAYDTTCIATTPTVEYELILPETGLPGWGEIDRRLDAAHASADFDIAAPSLVHAGTYVFKLRARVRWATCQTALELDVPWLAEPLPYSPSP